MSGATSQRSVFVAWQDPDTRGWRPVGRLTFEKQRYRFVYTKGAKAKNFTPFGRMTDLELTYESSELFPLFANRLLSKNRPEYLEYLGWLNLFAHEDTALSQLALTGGIRGTDSLMVFPCPEPQVNGTYHVQFLSHGLRYLAAEAQKLVEQLKPDTRLYLMYDVQNEQDPRAVSIRTEPAMIVGYVPRYFASDFRSLLSKNEKDAVKVVVERVNRGAPIQFRLLCSITANWPKGFQPCSGRLFQPLARTGSSRQKSAGRNRTRTQKRRTRVR